ncbi:TPA: transcriptional regulator [Vibrio vulnificus]
MCTFTFGNATIGHNTVTNKPYRIIHYKNGHYSSETLTTIEGKFIYLLLKERDVSRARCEEVLWEGRVVSDSSRSLTQVVSTLRKKLSTLGVVGVINTLPRKGYSLSVDVHVEKLREVVSPQVVDSTQTSSKKEVLNERRPGWLKLAASKYCAPLPLGRWSYVVVFCCLPMLVATVAWLSQGFEYQAPPVSSYSLDNMVDWYGEVNALGEDRNFKVRDRVVGFDQSNVYLSCLQGTRRINVVVKDTKLANIKNKKELERLCD